ncbi:type IV pilin protein [Thioflavicoccus mobilis]|nr:type IV pilin protein [Thioflavicoccus mobilis]
MTTGFTLIEMMVVVVLIAILATIAFPSYTSYIQKSQAKAAAADLVTLGLNAENWYARNLSYPTDGDDWKGGWSPSQGDYFTYDETLKEAGYALTATRKSGGDCTISLTVDDGTVTRGATGDACGFSTW